MHVNGEAGRVTDTQSLSLKSVVVWPGLGYSFKTIDVSAVQPYSLSRRYMKLTGIRLSPCC